MSLLLIRQVEGRRWIEPRAWPNSPDLPADRLGDLETSSNDLSVFACEDKDLAAAVTRIAVALTAKRKALKEFDCIVIPIRTLKGAGYKVVATPGGGQTADTEVNKQHHDIREITARRLVELLELMTPSPAAGTLPRRETVYRPILAMELRAAEAAHRVEIKYPDLREQISDQLAG